MEAEDGVKNVNGAFRLDGWCVVPKEGKVYRSNDPDDLHPLTPRAMAVLVYLADHTGEVVSAEKLLEAIWPNTHISVNAVHKCIAEIRQALEDDSRAPRILKTIPKSGYQLLLRPASVELESASADNSKGPLIAGSGWSGWKKRITPISTSLLIFSLLGVAFWWRAGPVSEAQPSVSRAVVSDHEFNVSVDLGDGSVDLNLLNVLVQDMLMRIESYPDAKVFAAKERIPELQRQRRDVKVSGIAGEIVVAIVPGVETAPHVDRYALSTSASKHSDMADLIVDTFAEDVAMLVDPEVVEAMFASGTRNLHAYRFAEQGVRLNEIGDTESFYASAERFRYAIAADSMYVEAYLRFCSTLYNYSRLVTSSSDRRAGAANEMLAMIDQAENAGIHPDAIESMRRIWRMTSSPGPDDLLNQWVTTLSANPNDSEALRRMNNLLTGVSRPAEARAYLDRAIDQLDSDEARFWMGLDYATILVQEGDPAAIPKQAQIVERLPKFVTVLYGLVLNHARAGNRAQANHYLARLQMADGDRQWAYAAEMMKRALLNEIALSDPELENMLADSRATNLARGQIYFVLGDVQNGVSKWRRLESESLPLLWEFLGNIETYFHPSVVPDPAYQAVLDELGVGYAWRMRVRDAVQQLAETVGLPEPRHWEIQPPKLIARTSHYSFESD